MGIMQERPLLHETEFFTEGVVGFSSARTRRADVFAATNHGATQRMVSTGAKLNVRKQYSYVLRLPWELEVPKGNAVGIWNPSQKHSCNPSGLCLFLKAISTAIPVFHLIPSFLPSPFCRKGE